MILMGFRPVPVRYGTVRYHRDFFSISFFSILPVVYFRYRTVPVLESTVGKNKKQNILLQTSLYMYVPVEPIVEKVCTITQPYVCGSTVLFCNLFYCSPFLSDSGSITTYYNY